LYLISRLGDLAAGGLVLVSLHVFALSRRGFAVTNIVLVGVWTAIAVAIARRHRLLAGDKPARREEPQAPARVPAINLARGAPSART
jgi:hypothetical protein